MTDHVLALDQGTTSTRAIVLDASGGIVAVAQREHSQIFPRAGWVEHDPIEIWTNTQWVIAAALGPVREYDERRQAGLVDTLRAYIDADFSITRAAREMHLHSNTLLYRLKRVRELTGRDPRNARDVVFLALSLRLDGEG